ncbi:MAG TPA: gephyrin-like molybdotransferase Glp [Candidatus Limnocylindria bacterium]|nr:gephyrin-like molybdotransferase Glp [Candidatus Limnocylindria bacterium]
MKTVDEHLADCLRGIDVLAPIELQLLDAQSCVLAEDVTAGTDLPVFDNSAMDGYAVRAADVATASPTTPVILPVVGDVPAGSTAAHGLAHGTAIRIMTGAPLPAGADAVVQVELTDGGIAKVQINGAVPVGRHVRRGGDDLVRGDLVLPAGTRLGPRQLGLLAAIGRDRVLARPKPRVVVLSTGSELVEPGAPAVGGQIWDSNSFLITTAAREAGAVAFRIGIVPDEPKQLLDAIEDQLIRADLVVTTGGVSVGAYDVVKEVMSRLGTVEFDRISMQPGMPQGRGVIGPDRTPIFTLPGNPVSAYVSFEVFVRPVIRQLLGARTIYRPEVRAASLTGFSSPAGKRQFARGALGVEDGRYVVQPLDGQGSHRVRDLAYSNSLIVVPEDVTEVPEGGTVKVMVLERRLT